MESFLFGVPVTTNALLPTHLLLLFVLLLRFVQFFVRQAEEVRLTDAAGSAICVYIYGESE